MHIPPESTGPTVIGEILPSVLLEIERNRNFQRMARKIEEGCEGDDALADERTFKGGPIFE